MRRGDLVTIALQGAYGKPRPALIVQSDLFSEHPSVIIIPITSELRDTPLFRVPIRHGESTGLRKPSEVMVDKVQTIPHEKIGGVFGRIGGTTTIPSFLGHKGASPCYSWCRRCYAN